MAQSDTTPPGPTAGTLVPVANPVAALPARGQRPAAGGGGGGWRRRIAWLILILVVLGAGGYGGRLWWLARAQAIPAGIAVGNGRLEAQEVDIATKFAGRIAEVLVDEGDTVEGGQIVARMDSQELLAGLRQAEARVQQAREQQRQAAAQITDAQARRALARQELDRAQTLLDRGTGTRQQADMRRAEMTAASAAVAVAEAQHANATQAIAAARAEVDRIQTNLDEATLRAPRAGRIQYRLAEPGEVLAAGGRVLTLIDLDNVYMTFFLPEREAGLLPIGAEARVLLDVRPDRPLPARITFVSAKAQFTPKEVETATERQKLMFRVKARLLDPTLPLIKPGLPGLAFARYDDTVAWPARLQ